MKINQLLMACFFTIGTVATASAISHSTSMEVTPLEDLMCEHGALNRVMLIYEEIIHRIDNNQKIPRSALRKSAEVIRDLIENHHEKLEEKYIFTALEKANLLVEEVKILREQHVKGRLLTKYIIENATRKGLATEAQLLEMRKVLVDFITMYRPHEAREDTVIFPAFKALLSEQEYAKLGEVFEKEEHRHFGEDPLDRFVETLAKIEKKLGIYALDQFTPVIK